MKILITTDLFTTNTNGVVTSVRNLRDELLKRGHEVRIITLSEDKKSRKEGDVYYVKSASLEFIYPNVRMPLSYKNEYVKELIEWKPDIIHSQCEFFSYQFALRISKATKAPIVHTYHTLYEDYVGYVLPMKKLGKWLVKKLVKKRLKRAHTVIAPTYKVEKTLLGYGVTSKLRVVPSGISLEQHKRRISRGERAEKRRELGISEEQFVMLNLGRLGTEKNVEELLAFFAKALVDAPDMVFLIVGDGPDKENLEKLSAELGLGGRVIFTGMVPPSEVQLYYQLGDVFVSASTSETQGLTYVEAMANGLPLLCREDDCLQEVLVNGVNGYGYADEQEFLANLWSVRENAEWRKEAGKRSEEIASRYDKSEFGRAVESVYNEARDEV